MANSELRQRKPQGDDPSASKKSSSSAAKAAKREDNERSVLDIFRVLAFLFLASCGLSYVITGGDSWFWGTKNAPDYLRTDWWKAQFRQPIYLTAEELTAFDGTDESKPLYLAINGTVYDVSNGRRMYGPGGSYQFFAGRDAARAFVTGCFKEDLTPDMRGVETMFLPLDDPEVDAHYTTAQIAEMRAQEAEEARERAHSALKHWVDFFAKSKKYSKVGYVKRDADWLEKLPKRELCERAQNGRKKRKLPTAD